MRNKINLIVLISITFVLSYLVLAGVNSITLSTPSNATYDLDGNLTFNCSGTANESKYITNTTLYVWNESGATIYNTTLNITDGGVNGTLNLSFTLNNLPELQGFNYTWNCLFEDNESNSAWGASNYTFGVDTTSPVVTLISPTNAGSDTDGTVIFVYNVTDANTIQNCSLYLDGVINQTNSTITRNINQNFSITSMVQSDSLQWRVNCLDLVNRTTNSSTYTLDTYANPPSTVSSNSYSGTMYNVGTLSGLSTIETLRARDYLYFEMGTDRHKIKIDEIKEDYVTVSVSSTTITKDVQLGNTEYFDIDGDEVYDLSVTLNSINLNIAEMTFEEYNVVLTTICTESWSCSEWSSCSDDQQTRTCIDLNNCGGTNNKPSEKQDCQVIEETTNIPEMAPAETSSKVWWCIGGIVIIGILAYLGWYFYKKK